jgi:dienelactone hydrolase
MNPEYSALEWANRYYAATERKLEFRATSREEAVLWRASLRGKIIELLGGFPANRVPLEVQIQGEEDAGDFIIRTLTFRSDEWSVVPADLLIPKDLKPGEQRPAVIAHHGHGPGRKMLLGDVDAHHGFGAGFARRGFVTLVPDGRGWGERGEEEGRENLNLMLMGKTIVGLRVWDSRVGFDLLQSLDFVAPDRLGMVGLSGGGTVTTFTAAVDERVKCTCISGYTCTWLGSIMAMNHCPCNFIPGILEWAENYDVAGLIAPRALIVEAGDKDPIFPLPAVEAAWEKLECIFGVYGARDKLDLDVFSGDHQFSGTKSYDFFTKHLMK